MIEGRAIQSAKVSDRKLLMGERLNLTVAVFLLGADAENCATEFVEWSQFHPEHVHYSDALLGLCAEHRAVDFIRNRDNGRQSSDP